MEQHKEDFIDKKGDQDIHNPSLQKRYPLVMIPKQNDFDPQFPAIFYRMGKYVTIDEANQQQNLEFMSKNIYDICVQQGREDVIDCYREKCGIFRTIIKTLRYGSASYSQKKDEK